MRDTLPSDFLLWGSDTAVNHRRKCGRKPCPSPIAVQSLVCRTRKAMRVRLLHPWFVDVAGWKLGDQLVFGGDWIEGDVFAAYLGLARDDDKGYKITPRTNSLDGVLVFPLDEDYPYLPKLAPVTGLEWLGEEGCEIWSFVVKGAVTVEEYLKDAGQ